jgi:dienelactone hydrolase
MTRLSTGAELRLTGPAHGDAVICMNGGQAAELEGTWSATLEFLVAQLAPRFPDLRFGEVRYRIKSWRRLDDCTDDARAAIEEMAAPRTLLLGFSMGGAVAIRCASEATVGVVLGIAPWIPDRLAVEPLRGKRLRVVHGSFDRYLPGIPGVSPALSRRGFDRALAVGGTGEYTLIPGAVHGIAVRGRSGQTVRLPRARRWSELVAAELQRWSRTPS